MSRRPKPDDKRDDLSFDEMNKYDPRIPCRAFTPLSDKYPDKCLFCGFGRSLH